MTGHVLHSSSCEHGVYIFRRCIAVSRCIWCLVYKISCIVSHTLFLLEFSASKCDIHPFLLGYCSVIGYLTLVGWVCHPVQSYHGLEKLY